MRSCAFVLLKLEPVANLPGAAAVRKAIATIEDFVLSGSRIRQIVNVGQPSIAGSTWRLLNVAEAASAETGRTWRHIDINLLESTRFAVIYCCNRPVGRHDISAPCGPA
jgi:hypothetical protein